MKKMMKLIFAATTFVAVSAATASANECSGTYLINGNGYDGTLSISEMSQRYMTGSIYYNELGRHETLTNVRCIPMGNRQARLMFDRVLIGGNGQVQSHDLTVTGSRQYRTLEGTFYDGRRTYSFSGQSMGNNPPMPPNNICSGSFAVMANGYSATFTFIPQGGNSVMVQIFYPSVGYQEIGYGTCVRRDFSTASVSFTRNIQRYDGTILSSGPGRATIGGSFYDNRGTYSWTGSSI